MNKTIVIIGVIVLILVGGGLFVANQNSQKAEQAKMEQEKEANDLPAGRQVQKDDAGMMKKEDDKMMADKSNARYVEYTKTVLDQSATHRRVLYFYANWCPICKPADANFKANVGKIPEDVTVIRINYNDSDTDQEEKDLAKKYGITYQHTFVQIDGQGKEVTKWNGGQTDELVANIK
ncbi:MAG: thioredoxin family protein [Candidatus Levybacteria bacterium]|nr:thioredoxin family protein [Candidatus Levybacteria bacterium]